MNRRRRWALRIAIAVFAALAAAAVGVYLFVPEALELLAHGHVRELDVPERPRTALTEGRPKLLVVAFDGVDRAILYGMLRAGELPGLAALLGDAEGGRFPHAHLDERLLATMPSSTMPGWATVYTGVPPAQHGVTGNEFFVRDRRQLAAPAPVSFSDSSPTLKIYTDDAADALLAAPTIFERMRDEDPGISIWTSMVQFHRGANRLLLARRSVLAAAFRDFLDTSLAGSDSRDVYEELDEEVVDTVGEELGERGAPDVLVVYLAGIDLYAHHAKQGPDEARRVYLREVIDPKLLGLRRALFRARALDDRYVVVVSEHGHTQVLEDDGHAIGTSDVDEAPAVLRAAGFRVRPFALEVAADHDYQAVLAYGGATAYVYLADRTTCPKPGDLCDFTRPPRYEEDVLPVAEAFLASSRDGAPIAGMRGTLDLVLTRRPRAPAEPAAPFAVYVGGGAELRELGAHLGAESDAHVAADRRLRDLAEGPLGHRAGDLMLIARNGGEPTPATRHYFSATAHSWHGSLSRKDAEVPLIVAHPKRSAEELRAIVDATFTETPPRLQAVGELLLRLRRGDGAGR